MLRFCQADTDFPELFDAKLAFTFLGGSTLLARIHQRTVNYLN
jgi:hypothetical protein